jgi:hypothetical protein
MKSTFTILLCLFILGINGQEFGVEQFYQVSGSGYESCFVQDVPGGFGKYIATTGHFDAVLQTGQSTHELGHGMDGVFIGNLWNGHWEWGYNIEVSMYTSNVNYHVDGYGNIHVSMGYRGHLWMIDKQGNILFEGEAEYRANMVAGFDMYGQLLYAFSLGNEYLNDIMAVTADNHGNTIIAGMFWGQLDFNPGEAQTILDANSCGDGFIAKYDGNQLLWAHHFPGTLNNYVWALDTDFNRNIYACGTFGTDIACSSSEQPFSFESKGGGDAYAASFSPDGDIRWGYQLGSSEYDRLNSLKVYADKVFFGGVVSSEITTFENSSLPNNGNADAVVLCMGTDGEFNWVRNVGGAGYDRMSCLDVEYYTGLWISGQSDDEIYWSDETQTLNPGTDGLKNFLIQVDQHSGELINYYSFGEMEYRQINSLRVEPHAATITMSGSFSDTVDFSINDLPFEVESIEGDDGFYVKYKYLESNDVNDVQGIEFSLSPNPVIDEIYIKTESGSITSYEIINIEGALIDSKKGLNQREIQVSVESFPPAIYILNVFDNDQVLRSKKFIKQ